MAESKESAAGCTSVFKSGKSTTTEQEFTQAWVTLINTLEKDAKIPVSYFEEAKN